MSARSAQAAASASPASPAQEKKPENLLQCNETAVNEKAVATARLGIPSDELIYKASEIASSLADTTRFKILAALAATELCVCELVEICTVSQSAVSHQLRLLRARGLVRVRREGQRAVYSLDDDHVHALIRLCVEHAAHLDAHN